jgi:hypothetical protein
MTYATAAQQVSWLAVHDFVLPKLHLVGDWPMIGSPAWCELESRDRVKWASVCDAAQHWTLRVETCQRAACEVSRDLSAAEDWLKVARIAQRRCEFYSARPWLRRGASR